MTSWQHQDWINHGRPDSGLALPLAQLRDELRAAGFTVYDWPNDAHLDAEPPEDHTFYAETGWPKPSPKWWRHAIDVMPKPGTAGARELWLLGARISADRQRGLITWLKYINRPPTSDLSRAIHESWEPTYALTSSTDAGHLHLSSITGVETLSSPYNPLAAAGSPSTVTTGGTFMALSDQQQQDMYEWIAGLMDEAGNPARRSRFQWRAPLLAKMHDTVDVMAADIAALKNAQTAPATVDVTALAAALQAAGVGQVDVPTLAAALAQHLPKSISLTGSMSGSIS